MDTRNGKIYSRTGPSPYGELILDPNATRPPATEEN